MSGSLRRVGAGWGTRKEREWQRICGQRPQVRRRVRFTIRKASSVSKAERDKACARVHRFGQAMINMIGEHRRRAYAHDLYYGMHKLYDLYGKPWNGSTEGGEHAHQEVKRMFLKMACHSRAHAAKYHGAQFQVLEQGVIKQQLIRKRALDDLNPSEYNAMRANTTFAVKRRVAAPEPGRGGRGRGRAGGRGGTKRVRTVVVEKVVGSKEAKYDPEVESKMCALCDTIGDLM